MDDQYNDTPGEEVPADQQSEPPQEPVRPPDGRPVPADFTDYDQYVEQLTEWQTKKTMTQITADKTMTQAVADGVTLAQERQQRAAQAQAEAQRITPYGDDPYASQRAELTRQSMELSRDSIIAEGEGKSAIARDLRGLQKLIEKDLTKLPPTPEQTYIEEQLDNFHDFHVSKLFDPALKDLSQWTDPRVQSDCAVEVERAMKRARNQVRLPMEDDGKGGNILPAIPKNMCTVQVPEDQMPRFKQFVFSNPDDTIDEKFRKAWTFLHEGGLARGAVKAFDEPERSPGGEETDPSKMNFAEFCKWREGVEERKRGKRTGFVMPQSRRRNG